MTTHDEQRTTQPNQTSGMYPTNSQTGGRGALNSDPAQDEHRGRTDNTNFNNGTENTQGSGFTSQPHQQGQNQQVPPPVHPDRVGQDDQFNQRDGQGTLGTGANQGQYDQYSSQGQNATQQSNQGLTSGAHHTGGTTRAAETGAAREGGKLAYDHHEHGEHEGRHDQGTGLLSGRHDQSGNTDQGVAGGNHTGGATRAAEAGAAYEGGKLAHDNHGNGEHGGQHNQGTQGLRHEQGTGPLLGQHDQHTNTNQGVTGGQHTGGATRAAEAGAVYEGGKLAHEAGGQGHHGDKLAGRHDNNATATNTNGPGYGTGPASGTTGTGAETGYPTGQAGGGTAHGMALGTGTGAGTGGVGTAAGLGGVAGAAHPGAGVGTGTGVGGATGAGRGVGGGPGAGANAGQGLVGTGTTTGTTATGAHPGAVPGAPAGTGTGTSSSGQANVIFGKIQQAGGMLLSNSEMKAKGLEREAKGVAVTDPQEANRLENKAATQWEKAGAGSKIAGNVAGDSTRRNL